MFAGLEEITVEKLGPVRNLVQAIFPVSYSNQFFEDCVKNENCRVIFDRGEVAAIVCAKPEITQCAKTLYIRSLGVSPLYREKGIGSTLLNFVEHKAREQRVDHITLHVQTSNKTAIEFYKNRGFVLVETVANYYRRCLPPDAYVMVKYLNNE